MKNIYIAWFLICLFGCEQKKEKCDLIYHGCYNTFCAAGKIEDGIENGRFIFTQSGGTDSFEEAGFYLDGIRNDIWAYRINNDLSQIKWGSYQDTPLNFRTNVFSEADSVKRGDYFTKFKFKSDQGEILLTVGINGPMKDSLPENNYASIIKSEFLKLGYRVLTINRKTVSDRKNKIYVNEVVVNSNDPGEGNVGYLKNAFGRMGNDFVDFTVKYNNKDNQKALILFEGVLTNFYLDRKRWFNPFN